MSSSSSFLTPTIPSFLRPSLSRNPSSAASISSTTSSSRAVYAKDGQGHDFTSSYPHQAREEPLLHEHAAPIARLAYAKDGKGFDFTETYTFSKQQTSATRKPFRRAAYSKDGQGFDFSESYARRK